MTLSSDGGKTMNKAIAYYITFLRKDFVNYCNQKLSNIGLSQGLLFFILYVGKHPNCAPKELAQALHMDFGHTTRSIAKLKKDGFLEQEVNPKDRRTHALHLTDVGKEAFNLSYELFSQWDKEILNNLSAEEQEQLGNLLQKATHIEASNLCDKQS